MVLGVIIDSILDIVTKAIKTGGTVIDRDTSLYLTRSVQDSFPLKGRVTIIIGGARGIGLAWVFACVEAGSAA